VRRRRRFDACFPASTPILCQGAFSDLTWFRSVTTLIKDPGRRAEHIDFGSDWWYVDDLASKYLLAVDKGEVMAQPRRICMPQPNGDGQDIIEWLHGFRRRLATRRPL
jgi:hypothetical protein